MCGIAGYYGYGGAQAGRLAIDRPAMDRMVDALAHRGPDGRGVYQAPGVGLGHRRLAIIDVLDRAAQPMKSPDGLVVLTFNGEIYNFRSLRRELESLGHAFVTTSDTEVLLHAYLQWDVGCVHRLDGIFAFGIHDARLRRLWLVRDPMGVKPLFYSDRDGEIVFASEVGSLMRYPGFDGRIDPLGMDCFFTFSYVPAPLSGYRHIRQLLPGQCLLAQEGRVRLEQYWRLPPDLPKVAGDSRELTAEYDRLLTAAVERQMVADVPLGAFLSSGTDSFAVVRAMQKVSRGQTRAFTVGFEDRRFDELPHTRAAAAALGVQLDWQVMRLGSAEMEDLTARIAPHCREPFADSSALAVYLLCQSAARKVKVALGGDGPDELLGGYATYAATRQAERYRCLPRWLRRGVVEPLVRHVPEIGGKYSLRERLGRFVAGAEEGPWRDHASWRVLLHRALRRRLYRPEFWKQVQDFDPLDLYVAHMDTARQAGCSRLDCLLYADLLFHLPNDMLVKVDRMSMAHGLEVRVPMLDLDLVRFSWRLPESMKVRGGCTKYILRRVIADLYPPGLKARPKSGFNVPFDPRAPTAIVLGGPFFRDTTLEYGECFSRYHQMMIRHMLRMAPPGASMETA